MTNTRWVLRIILVLLVIGVGYLAFASLRRGTPDDSYQRAMEHKAAGRIDEALAILKGVPNDVKKASGPMNKLEAELLLEEERKQKPNATYGDNPRALNRLEQAAVLMPNDMTVQKALLTTKLEKLQLFPAVTPALKVLASDPVDDDALFTLAMNDINNKKYRDAEARIKRMDEVRPAGRYRTLALKLHFNERTKNIPDARRVLDDFTTRTMKMSSRQIGQLDSHDRHWLFWLLNRTIIYASDMANAQIRAADALAILEDKLLEAEKDDKEKVEQIAEVSALLRRQLRLKRQEEITKGNVSATNSPGFANVSRRMSRIGQHAIGMEVAGPIVYIETADALLDMRDPLRSLDILRKGLEAAKTSKNFDAQSKAMAELHRDAARQLTMLQHYDEAREHIEPLLSNEDTAGIGHMLAAELDLSSRRYEEALEHLLQCRKKMGDTTRVRMMLARAYQELERWQESLPLLESLHLKDRDQLDIEERAWVDREMSTETLHLMQIKAYLQINKPKDAERHMQALVGTETETKALAELFDFLYDRGQTKRALGLLQASYKLHPTDRILFEKIVKFYKDRKRIDIAGQIVEDFFMRSASTQRDLAAPLEFWTNHDRPQEAMAYVDKMLRLYPEETVLMQLKAAMLDTRGLYAEELEVLERLERLRPDWSYPHFLKAQVWNTIRNPDRAVDELTKALALDPNDRGSRLLLVQLIAQRGDPQVALQETQKLIDQNPNALDAHFLQVDMLEQMGFLKQAINNLERLKAQFKEPEIYARLATAHARANNPELGERVLREGMEVLGTTDQLTKAEIEVLVRKNAVQELNEKYIDSADQWLWKAQSWDAVGRVEHAIRALEKALEIDKEHKDSRMMLARMRFARSENDAALAHIASVLRHSPQDWNALLLKAQCQVRLGLKSEAVASLRRMIEADPKRVLAYTTLAGVLMGDASSKDSDPEGALDVLRKGAEMLPNDLALVQSQVELLTRLERVAELQRIAPNNPEVHFYKAQAWRNMNKPDLAMQELNQVLKLNAEHMGARLMAIEVSLAQKRNELALDHVEEAMRRIRPAPWTLFQLKSAALTQLGRRNDAIDLIKDFISKNPLNAPAYMVLSRNYLDANEPDAALQVMEDALTKMPDNVRLLQEKINILVDENRDEELRRMDPQKSQVAYFQALAWRSRNRLDRAMEDLERCLNLQQNHVAARTMAAEIALARRDYRVALAHARAATALDPHNNATLIQAEAARGMGLRAEAKKLLEDLIKERPRTIMAYQRLAELLGEIDDINGALKVLQDARAMFSESTGLVQAEIRLLAKSGRLEEAIKLAEVSAGEKPDFSLCQSLAQAFYQGEAYEPARHWAERSVKVADEFQRLQASMTLGMIAQASALRSKDPAGLAEARRHYEEVLRSEPTDYAAGNNLAWLLAEEFNQAPKALELLTRVRGKRPLEQLPVGYLDTLVRTYRRLNRVDEAIKTVDMAVQVNPNSAELFYQKGLIAWGRKQGPDARRALLRAVELGNLDRNDLAEAKRILGQIGPEGEIRGSTEPSEKPAKPDAKVNPKEIEPKVEAEPKAEIKPNVNVKPADVKPATPQPADLKPEINKPAAKKPADDKPADLNAGEKPAVKPGNPADLQPEQPGNKTDDKPADLKPTGAKIRAKPAEIKTKVDDGIGPIGADKEPNFNFGPKSQPRLIKEPPKRPTTIIEPAKEKPAPKAQPGKAKDLDVSDPLGGNSRLDKPSRSRSK